MKYASKMKIEEGEGYWSGMLMLLRMSMEII
jgi:hypothetical protein